MNSKFPIFVKKLDCLNFTDYYGLNSPGLTCYLNSVLQVLFMTVDFREAIERSCSDDPTPIDLHLRRLFEDLSKSTTKTHSVIEKLGITDVYEQRDAAEYFEKILHLTSPGASKIFKGELNHITRCLHCKKSNDSRSFFWMLPLVVEASDHHAYSVKQGLKTFFKRETVSEDNRMYCHQCNQKREAEITCEMTRNPKILTLLLKRFRFDYKQKCFVKLHCEVEAPQTLKFETCIYDLYALVNHYGNLTGGHYTAEIKSFETGEWYNFNDDVVNMHKPLFGKNNTFRSRSAYLLMYKQRRTCSESSDEDKLEAQCAHSDVAAEGRCEETARDIPRHLLKEDTKQKRKHFNGGMSEKIYDDKFYQHNNSAGAAGKLLKGTVPCPSEPHENIYKPGLRTEKSTISTSPANEEHHTPNRQQCDRNSKECLTTRGPPTNDWRAQHCDGRLEQNSHFLNETLRTNDINWEGEDNRLRAICVTNSSLTGNTVNPAATKVVKNKGDGAAEVPGITQRTNTDISGGNSYATSNGCSPRSSSTRTRCSHSRSCTYEPFVYNFPCTCEGNSAQRNRNDYVTPMQGVKTASQRNQTKIKNKSGVNVERTPWKY